MLIIVFIMIVFNEKVICINFVYLHRGCTKTKCNGCGSSVSELDFVTLLFPCFLIPFCSAVKYSIDSRL